MATADFGVAETPQAEAPAQRRLETPVSVQDVWGVWRAWVSNHVIGSALIVGAVATHITTVLGIWFFGWGLPQLNWPQANGAVIFRDFDVSAVVQFTSGAFIHYLDGLIFALLFVLTIHPLVPLANNLLGNVVKAVGFAMVLATISTGYLVPYVYFPQSGAGIFGTGFGWKLVFAVYLWHLIWGLLLGTLYAPLKRERTRLRQVVG